MAVTYILIHRVGDYLPASYGSVRDVSSFALCETSSWLFYHLRFFLAKQVKPRQTQSRNDMTFSYIKVLVVSWAFQTQEINTFWVLAPASGVL